MEGEEPSTVTQLMQAIRDGDEEAKAQLVAALYDELRQIAGRILRRANACGKPLSLRPTELVHEYYLRIIKQRKAYDNRGQFFAIATQVMKRVIVDHVRRKFAEIRGGSDRRRERLSDLDDFDGIPVEDLELTVDLMDALDRLRSFDSRKADIADMKLIWALTIKEIAESLGVSHSTVERDWQFVRAWLRKELAGYGWRPPEARC